MWKTPTFTKNGFFPLPLEQFSSDCWPSCLEQVQFQSKQPQMERLSKAT